MHVAQLMSLPLTISCSSKIQIGFTFLAPAHPGSLGQRTAKWGVVIFEENAFQHDYTTSIVCLSVKNVGDCDRTVQQRVEIGTRHNRSVMS